MGGITTGIGLASGIDTGTLIERLLSLEARPRTLAQQRLVQLQTQQAAYLDLNSRLNALKTAAAKFRTGKVFDTMRATSADPAILTATASTAAQAGNYKFIVDRLVTSQQVLSRGFADKDNSALGATSFTFESAVGRLDRDTNLADLNGGEGIERGKITLTVNGTATTVDLSRVATVSEVLEAINGSGTGVTASVQDGRFVLRAANPADTLVVSDAAGSETATSLGIAGTAAAGVLTGSGVYSLSGDIALSALNDGNGVEIREDRAVTGASNFTITVGATKVNIYLGAKWQADPENPDKLIEVEGAVSTLGQAIERINEQLETALTATGQGDVSVRLNATTGTGLELVNDSGEAVVVENRFTGSGATKAYRGTTATDLGLAEAEAATAYNAGATAGKRLLAGLNSTLARNLNGGSGIAVNAGGLGEVSFTDRAGNAATVTFDADSSIEAIIRAINDQAPANISAALNAEGTGIIVSDATATGSITGNLIIGGPSAGSLGIETDPAGVGASTVDSDSLQHAYVTNATLVSSLNGGKGIGTGKFRITGPTGGSTTIDIGSDTVTVGDLLQEIDSAISSLGMNARINDRGDGIVIEEQATTPGAQKIKIEDTTGGVASALKIEGEAAGTGSDNFIDGSYESLVEFEATDTLAEIVSKINQAGAGVAASILSSGASSKPYRISLSSTATGTAGRVIIDTNGFDLGLETLEEGTDARVFLGSTDPAQAILLQSSTNTMDQVISGVSIDLNATSEDPVELTITRDTAAFEAAVNEFINAFNAVVGRIDEQSTYNPDTKKKGIMLGDGTVQGIRQNLFTAVQDDGTGMTGQFKFLTQIGIGFSDGKLTFDRDRFRTAMEEDFQAVKDIFSARVQEAGSEFQPIPGLSGASVKIPQDERGFTRLGAVGALEEIIKDYVDSIDGSFTKRNEAIGDQIELQQQRITFLTEKLNVRREVLQRQFAAMEQAISNLQSQGSVLGSIQSIG